MMQLVKLHCLQRFNIKRVLPIMVYLVVYTAVIVLPFRQVAKSYQEMYSYALPVLILTSRYYVAFMMIGAILFYSNLPFKDSFQFWLILKVGYGRWIRSQLGYIVVSSLAFILYNLLLMWSMLLPYLQFGFKWGKLTVSMSAGRIPEIQTVLGNLHFDRVTLDYYMPLQAFVQVIVIWWLVLMVVAFIILVFNLVMKQLGTLLASGLVVVALFIEFAAGFWVQYLSPLTWLSIYYIRYEAHSALPTFEQVIAKLGIALVGLSIGLYYTVKRQGVKIR